MKINGRKLTTDEVELFNMNPRSSEGIRVVGFLTDVIIFTLMLITVFVFGGWSVWLFYLIYTFLLIITIAAFVLFVNKDPRAVDEDMRSRLICYANSAVDWPLGFLGLFSTTKNFIIMLASIPLAMYGETYLALVLVVCWIINNMAIYARGDLTLKLIDLTLKKGQYAE